MGPVPDMGAEVMGRFVRAQEVHRQVDGVVAVFRSGGAAARRSQVFTWPPAWGLQKRSTSTPTRRRAWASREDISTDTPAQRKHAAPRCCRPGRRVRGCPAWIQARSPRPPATRTRDHGGSVPYTWPTATNGSIRQSASTPKMCVSRMRSRCSVSASHAPLSMNRSSDTPAGEAPRPGSPGHRRGCCSRPLAARREPAEPQERGLGNQALGVPEKLSEQADAGDPLGQAP